MIFLLGLLAITWFRGNFLVNPGDTNFSFNPINDLYRSLFVWDHQQELGRLDSMAAAKIFPYNAMLAVLVKIGLSIYSAQKILFYLLFTLPGIGAYLLIKFILKDHPGNKIAAFTGAVFYMMNSFLLQLRWGDTYYMSLFFYMVFPYLVLFWSQGIEQKSFKYSIFFAFAFLFGLPALTNIAYIIPVVVFIFINVALLMLANLRNRGELKFLIKFLVGTTMITLFVSSYWLVSQIIPLENQISNLSNSTNQFEIVKSGSLETSFFNIFRGLGYWGFFGSYNSELYHPFSVVYKSGFFVFLGFIISILALMPIALLKKFSRRNQISIILFNLILLIGFWLIKSAHEPSGGWYYWALDTIPFFKIFRFAHDKFGSLIPLGISVNLGFLIIIALDNIKNYYLKLVFVLTILTIINIYAWPFWTGDLWRKQSKTLPGYRFTIPERYYSLKDYTSNKIDGKIFNLPDNKTGVPGIVSVNLNGNQYIGADPLNRILSMPIYYLNEFNFDNYGTIINSIYTVYSQYPKEFINLYKKISGIFNTKYILLRGDSENKTYPLMKDYKYIKPYLDDNYKLIKQFDNLYLYGVNDKDFYPQIYIPEKIIETNESSNKIVDIGSLDSFEKRNAIYFDQAKFNQSSDLYIWPEKSTLKDKIESGKNITVFYPLAYSRPVGFIWKVNLLFENFDEWLSKKDINKIINKKIFYANARITEMINSMIDKNIIDVYNAKISQAIELTHQLPYDQKMIVLAQIEGNIKSNQSKLEQKANYQLFANLSNGLINYLEQKIYNLQMENLSKLYNIPEDGEYAMLTKERRFFDKMSQTDKDIVYNENWKEYGKYFLKSGRNYLKNIDSKVVDDDNTDVIFVRKRDINLNEANEATIEFQKISPTKYIIKISNATAPYHLIFSDTFNKNWDLYYNELGKMKSVSSSTHEIVNGYANSWRIVPQDVNYNQNYELIIEFSPQKTFNMGIMVSIFSIIICLIYLIIKAIKKYQKNYYENNY